VPATVVPPRSWLARRQKLVPGLQPLISRINNADSATLITMDPRQPNWLAKKKNTYRSPLSPCPDFTFIVAFLRRSALSDRPTSSDSLNCPSGARRTYRLSVPVAISARVAAFFLPIFFSPPFSVPLSSPCSLRRAVQLGCRRRHDLPRTRSSTSKELRVMRIRLQRVEARTRAEIQRRHGGRVRSADERHRDRRDKRDHCGPHLPMTRTRHMSTRTTSECKVMGGLLVQQRPIVHHADESSAVLSRRTMEGRRRTPRGRTARKLRLTRSRAGPDHRSAPTTDQRHSPID
jgi:hypothetical protein